MKLPVRLMMRAEGERWNAYFGTGPADAIMIGSISMGIVTKSEDLKKRFLAVMTDAVALAIKDVLGQTPHMEIQDAPDSERSGNA